MEQETCFQRAFSRYILSGMEKQLTLLTWPDYINPLTLGQFELEFGVSVRVETVPSAVEMMGWMRSAGAPVDVLCPPDYAVRELTGEN